MTKVLVLGGSGMLGTMVTRVLSESSKMSVVATYRTLHPDLDVDVRWKQVVLHDTTNNIETLRVLVRDFDYIVNCIGITKPYINEQDSGSVMRAINLNSTLPYELQLVCNKNVRLVAIATDCVFSGKNESGYDEDSPHDANDVYGKTKSLGEHPGMIIRTSIIGPNSDEYLWSWFTSQSQNASVNGFNNHLWNGVTTLQFAKIVRGIIEKELYQEYVTHLVPANILNKYQLLQCLSPIRPDITINEVSAAPCNRSLRTNNHDLNQKLWTAAEYESIPTIGQMIAECIEYSQI